MDLHRVELMNQGAWLSANDKEPGARRRHRWDMRAMTDSPEDLAGFYGAGILFDRNESIEQRIEANAAVTARQIQDLAALVATADRLNVLAVGDMEEDEEEALAKVVRAYVA